MTTITLEDLPAPPLGMEGWPWTEQAKPLPASEDDPEVAVAVTPTPEVESDTLERALRSVLLQSYPNVTCHVVESGIDESSREVLDRYERWVETAAIDETHRQGEVGRTNVDAIQPRRRSNLLDFFDTFLGFYHGNASDLIIGLLGITTATIQCTTNRPE